jgi:hypothetical protein
VGQEGAADGSPAKSQEEEDDDETDPVLLEKKVGGRARGRPGAGQACGNPPLQRLDAAERLISLWSPWPDVQLKGLKHKGLTLTMKDGSEAKGGGRGRGRGGRSGGAGRGRGAASGRGRGKK